MAKFKVLAECFHGGSLRKPGDVIDYDGPEVKYLEKVKEPKADKKPAGQQTPPPGGQQTPPAGEGDPVA